MGFIEILEYNFIEIAGYSLNLAKLLTAIFILLGAKVLIRVIHRAFLKRFFYRKGIDIGRQFAIYTFIKYILYTGALLWSLSMIGIHLSVLWAGAAALLVGIGLGLQQTFNDLVSGIILLIEGTVDVGDVIIVDGLVGTVKSIGIRTSKVDTRDEISIIIPNSKLVVDNVVNLSHNKNPTRFIIKVGVAYASDVKLVTSLLLQAAKDNKAVLSNPPPRVQFKDFGNSSLDFELLFFSNEFLGIEFIKSEIRYKITELFRKNNVEIPFPQRDLWLRNADAFSKKQPDE